MNNLDTFFQQFEEWVLWDIKYLLKLEDEDGNQLLPDRTTDKNRRRPFVASVILICCAIDTLTAFRYGRKNNKIGKTYKKFIQDYFTSEITNSKKSYNKDHIYNGLRNALLHGYSLGKDLVLSHTDEEDHLKLFGNRTMIDVFMLYYDLEAVYKKYKNELESGLYLNEFNARWDFAPVVRYIPDENIKR